MHSTYIIDLSATAAYWWAVASLGYTAAYAFTMRHNQRRDP